jgi:hypothetical protein
MKTILLSLYQNYNHNNMSGANTINGFVGGGGWTDVALSPLDMNGFKVTNLAPGTGPTDAVTVAQLYDVSGPDSVMFTPARENLDMSGFRIQNIAPASISGDVPSYGQILSLINDLSGSTASDWSQFAATQTVNVAGNILSNVGALTGSNVTVNANTGQVSMKTAQYVPGDVNTAPEEYYFPSGVRVMATSFDAGSNYYMRTNSQIGTNLPVGAGGPYTYCIAPRGELVLGRPARLLQSQMQTADAFDISSLITREIVGNMLFSAGVPSGLVNNNFINRLEVVDSSLNYFPFIRALSDICGAVRKNAPDGGLFFLNGEFAATELSSNQLMGQFI